MASSASMTKIQEAYVAFYGRAADAAGQTYWADRYEAEGWDAIVDAFGNSAEATALYGAGGDEAQVQAIYNQMFGRDGDAEGVAFYTDMLTSGAASASDIAARIFDGATGDDATILANKVAVADKYTASVAANADASYTDAAAARTFLSTVTASTDAATVDTDAEVAASQVTVAGQTFTLTTGVDSITTTAGNDTITAAAGTLATTDSVLDSTTDDNDSMTIVASATATPTITNVENISMDWDSNATIQYDLSNVSGATVSITNDTLAFAGTATIAGTGSNNLTFDSAITGRLTANGVVDSTINAGNANALTLAAGTSPIAGGKTKADVTINKTMSAANAVVNAVDELTIRSTVADAKFDLTSGDIIDKLTVAGTNSIIVQTDLNAAAEKIYNELTGGATLTVISDVGGAANIQNINADLIKLTAAVNGALTVAAETNLEANIDMTDLQFTAGTGVTNPVVNLSLGASQTDIDASGAKTLNITATDNITIATTALDDDSQVNYLGAKNITVTAQTVTGSSSSVDASAMTGNFTYTSANAATGIVGSATGKNTITLANTTTKVGFVGGSNIDTVTTSTAAFTSGSLNLTLGGGNDSVTLGTATVGTGTITIDGGTGTDKLTLNKVDNVIGAKLNLTGIEEIVAIDDAQFNETHLSGKTYKMSAVTADDGIIVTVANSAGASSVTTDLSGLTFNTALNKNVTDVTTTLDDGYTNVFTGSTVIDVVNASTGQDTITISNGGVDVIAFAAGDSTEAKMDKIIGFTAGLQTSAANGDKLDLVGTPVILTAGTAADGVVTADTSVASAVAGGTSSTVTATISSGLMTISGAGAGSIDTLAEWIDAATILVDTAFVDVGDAVAFEFGSNTYVYVVATASATAGDASDDVATFDVIELTGLSTATAMSTTAAANTIFVG